MCNDQSNKGDNKDKNQSTQEENELLKLKLSAEYGGQFSEKSTDLPEEVENQWLKQIKAFEEAHENVVYTTVHKKIGQPEFPKADDLSDDEVSTKLEEVQELLGQYSIALDVIGEYDDRVIYRFITEELFEHEMEDMDVPGMTNHFIYEEFHPNPKLDAQDALRDIFIVLNKTAEDDYLSHATIHFHEKGITDSKGQHISSDEVEKRVALLQNSIETIAIDNLEEGNVQMLSESEAVYTAKILFHIKWKGEQEKTIEDTCSLTLNPSEFAPMWNITKMVCPEITL